MTSFAWKWNRLRAMSLAEVLHRVVKWLTTRIEQQRIAWGWVPEPPTEITPRRSLFSPTPGWEEEWRKHFLLEDAHLDDLLTGRIKLFGYPRFDVGKSVNWHRDPLSGTRAPLTYGKILNYRDASQVGNSKVLWELGRHQHLIPLALAYAVTGRKRYKEAVGEQIDSWVASNPFGMGIHWCSSLELALRLISWAVIHSLFSLRDGEEGLFAAVNDSKGLGRSIYQQVFFVRGYLSRYSSANNHLIGELTGLWTACQVFNLGSHGERWASQAHNELERQAYLQVYGDGVDKEQSVYYHLWVLEYLLFSWLIGALSGKPFSYRFRSRILAMAAFLHDVSPAGGLPPQIGDADDGFVVRFDTAWPSDPYYEVLSAVEVIFGQEGLYRSGRPPSQKAFWYAMIDHQFEKVIEHHSTEPKRVAYPRVYRDGGYAILGAGPAHVLFDAGPLGHLSIAAHGHADALSFCLAIRGLWWLIDPGTYSYHDERRWRDYFRGTSAHNTLLVDGKNQSLIGGPFLWLKHARAWIDKVEITKDGGQRVCGSHDGYQHMGVLHTRQMRLSFDGRDISISDRVEGDGVHELVLHFHFSPDIDVALNANNGDWIATRKGSSDVLIIQVNRDWRWDVLCGSEDPILGWYSPVLGKKQPIRTLRGHWRGKLPITVDTHLHIDRSDL